MEPMFNIGEKALTFETFRRNLLNLINAKGMMYKDVAADIGVTPPTISRYITTSREPELENVYRISKYFNVSMDWLLGVAEEKYDIFRPEISRVAKLYSFASDEDKAVIDTVLRKYADKL